MNRLFKIFSVATLFTILATFTTNAQIYYGVKAGTNVSTVSDNSTDGLGSARSEYGYQVGGVLGAKIPIVGIGVEAEALWVNNKLSFDNDGGDVNSNSIEIPVMLSVPLLPLFPLSLKAGPSFVVYNSADVTYSDGSTKSLDPVKSSVGYTVGLGLKVLKFTLDVRYNGQFKSETPFASLENAVSSYDLKANTVSASIGYRF